VGSTWLGAPEDAAVFATGALTAAGLDERAVVAALQRFSQRALVGDCVSPPGGRTTC
jgi:hypothetical protein